MAATGRHDVLRGRAAFAYGWARRTVDGGNANVDGAPAATTTHCLGAAMRARVIVRLKPGVLDPQGAAVEKSLQSLGFDGVRGVRISKMIELDVDASDVADAKAKVTAMAEQLLRNPVIEDAVVSVDTGEGA